MNLTKFALLSVILTLASCGYIGPPLPPALNTPTAVTDLAVRQRGDKVLISFTIPPLTTEGLPLTTLDAVELVVGDKSIPVTADGPGVVTTDTPITGAEMAFRVRLKNTKGRYSQWSNLVVLNPIPPLPRAQNLKAKDVPQGVELTWQAAPRGEVEYRIYRQAEKEPLPVEVGRTKENRYIDTTSEYGKAYSYIVQAILKEVEGDPSDVAAITPKDEFAPAVPSGANAIAGVSAIELSWDRNSEPDFKQYRIYRSADGGAFTKLAEGLETPTYSDRAIESGKRYSYAITSVDQLGNESEKSAPVEIQAP